MSTPTFKINEKIDPTKDSLPLTKSTPTTGKRGSNHFPVEMLHLFAVMERVLPIGPVEWDLFLSSHSVTFPGRDIDSIRRKYTTTHRKKMPTGSPNMPPEIALEKRDQYLIGKKAELGGKPEDYNMMYDDSVNSENIADEDVMEDDTMSVSSSAIKADIPQL